MVQAVERALELGHGADHLPELDRVLDDIELAAHDRAVLLHLRSRVHRQSLSHRLMLDDATAAADIFDAIGDAAAEARAAGIAAIAAAESGDVFVAADLAVRARVADDGKGTTDPWVLNRIGIFCHQMYDISAALEWWRRGVETARQVNDSATEVLLVHNIAEATYSAVRMSDLEPERVESELTTAEHRCRWLAEDVDGRTRMPVDGARLLAQVRSACGRHDEALVALAQARDELRGSPATLVQASYDAAEGYCLLGAGDPEGALAALDRSLGPRPPDALDTETLLVRTDRGEALERLGRSTEALQEVRRAAGILVSRLRRQGQGVLREVDLRAAHELERSRLLRQTDRLVHDNQRDPLTDAGNRRRLDVLTGVLREREVVGACIIDLDRFKQVNDQFGHAVGDAVLVETVRTMVACCRGDDEVIRLGGEEFLLLCPDTDARSVAEVAERLRTTLADQHWAAVHRDLAVTASVGSASGHGALIHDTIARADAALLAAKRAGRNRVRTAPDPDQRRATA